jgi:hypothetical protein
MRPRADPRGCQERTGCVLTVIAALAVIIALILTRCS